MLKMSDNKPLEIDDIDDVPLAKKISLHLDDVPLAKRWPQMTVRRSSMLSSDAGAESERSDVEPKRKHDKFCWECHKRSDQEVLCSTCVVSFHKYCLPDEDGERDDWKCPECKSAMNVDESSSVDSLGKYIIYVFEHMIRKVGTLNDPEGIINNPSLINPITYACIEQKAKKSEYPTTHAFLHDVKWLLHNIEILRKNNKRDKKQLLKFRDVTKVWLKNCIGEIEDLKYCVDCYITVDATKSLFVCSKPHLVVWVKYGSWPYWPAKVKSIDDSDSTPIEVCFFDENHDTALVTYSDCYLFSKDDPNEYLTEQYKKEIQASMEEANDYIKNIENKFGPFHYAPLKTVPIKGKMDSDHLDEMIPGFRDLSFRPQRNESNALEAIELEPIIIVDDDSDDSIDQTDSIVMKVEIPEAHLEPKKEPKPEVIEQTNQEHLNQIHDTQPNEECIKISLPKSFTEEIRFCRDYFLALKKEYDSQKTEIIELRKEVNGLKGQNDVLKLELKTQHANNLETLNKSKLSQCCKICLSKVDAKE